MKGLNNIVLILIISFLTIESTLQGTKYEAENATISGSLVIESVYSGYSGSGYVARFEENNDKVTFNFNIDNTSYYNIYIGFATPYGEKINILNINGNKTEVSFPGTQIEFTEILYGKVKLFSGENFISIEKSWGWFLVDYIRIEKNNDPVVKFKLPYSLITPDPMIVTQRLHNYLMVNYENNIHSGAMSLDEKEEAEWIHDKTGKYPALIGLDFMNHNRDYSWFDKSILTKTAINWYNQNGLVTICWHWRDPLKTTDEFYANNTTFDVSKVNDTSSAEYKAMITDIDLISGYISELQDSTIPILWRPLHEASGQWFWWGAKGAEPCKELWKIMFNRMVNYHGIKNLIWIWTTDASQDNMDWYPGDEYVDILGVDIYAENGDFGSQILTFDAIKEDFEGKKLVTLSECGVIPDPDNLQNDKASWSWFMPWYGDFIRDESINPLNHWQKIMDHEYVITLDEMPDLRNYTEVVYIEKINVENNFQVYVNQNEEILYINPQIDNYYDLCLFDLSGRLLIQKTDLVSQLSINLSGTRSGIYVVKIVSNRKAKTYKVYK